MVHGNGVRAYQGFARLSIEAMALNGTITIKVLDKILELTMQTEDS